MIYEHRTYRLKNGTVPEYLRLVGEVGLPIQRRHLGQLIGYFTTDIGVLNEITHIWAFADHADRTQRRAELMADPDWQEFLPKIQVLIREGSSKILTPVPFSPLT